MRILGIIPARFGSSRFPGKPLIDLKGKTMIHRVYESVVDSGLFDEVIVATDDKRIFQEVESFGGNVELTSLEHATGTDRCGEIIERNPGFDVVINIQGDEPLVNALQLRQLIELFTNESVQIGTLVTRKISQEDVLNVNRIKVVVDKNVKAIYFSRSPIPNTFHAKEKAFEKQHYLRHIGLYGYRAETLKQLVKLVPCELEQMESLEQLRWMYNGFSIHTAETEIETPNIDTPDDVEKVLALL